MSEIPMHSDVDAPNEATARNKTEAAKRQDIATINALIAKSGLKKKAVALKAEISENYLHRLLSGERTMTAHVRARIFAVLARFV